MVAQFPVPAPTTSDVSRSTEFLHPEVKFHVYVNHLHLVHTTVDVSVQINNVKIELIEATFEKIQNYIAQTIVADMNPGVNLNDGSIS